MILRIVLILQVALKVVVCSEDEERLVRDLFRDYNKLIRPVEVMNETVEVEFGLNFIQLINVHWMDYQLRWDEADYGGIGVLRLPPDKVWKPDVVLFNNADGNYEVRYKSNALIYASGKVEWIPPAIFQSSCTIDVTYFPFDQQKCVMKFGSWTFNGDQVALKLHNDWVDLSDYWKSGTWDIVEVPAYLNVYNGTKNGKPTETDISFYITIRRKTLFYTVNLILPTLLISFLCILVFYLPAEAGEKVTLGISILLSLVVFLLLVSKILPPTSLVLPLIAKYLLFTFVMNCISILATVIIINWNFRGPRTHKMPNWVRTVFLKYLPIVLLIRRPKKTRLRWMMDMPSMGVHYHPYDHQQQMMQQQQSSPLYPLSPPAEQGINTNNGFSNNMVNTGTVSSCKDAPSSFNNFRSRKDSQVVLDYSCLDVPSPPVPTSLQHLQHPSPPVPASLQHLQHPGQQMLQHHPSCTISQGHIHNRTVEHLMHQTASSSTASPLGLAGSGLARSINGHGDPRRYSLDGGGGGATCEGIGKMMGEGEDDSVDTLYLTPEAYRATEAIEFIAGHLRSEDEYIQIREDWKYVAMVIDRLQLYLFFLVTTFGTLAILLDAPHIFEFVDQDKVIQMNSKGSS